MQSLLKDYHPPAVGRAASSPLPGRAGGGLRDRLKLIGAVSGLLVALLVTAWQLFGGPPSPGTLSRQRTVIDSETKELIVDFMISDGGTAPWKNPKTGRNTLYPAEPCLWTRDGKAKINPTWVLLNEYQGQAGETICPDCGRRVVSRNPTPPAKLLVEAAERDAKGGK